jgi:hypothetical protein
VPIEVKLISGYDELEPWVAGVSTGSALSRAQIARAKQAGLDTLFAGARPWQHQQLYESLGYEPRATSIDFQGPLQ